MKLSDTQLQILSTASRRTDHSALLPANLNGSAAKKVIEKLLSQKLLQELQAKEDMPIWRRGDGDRSFSLRITKAGLRAIEFEDVAEASENRAAADLDGIEAPDVRPKPTQANGRVASPERAEKKPVRLPRRQSGHLLIRLSPTPNRIGS